MSSDRDERRYDDIEYRRSGRTGLVLPAVSLGLWHNFGGVDSYQVAREMVLHAFDLGITHFDLANNYGPPPGSAETTFGEILRSDLDVYRDQLVISTKAGYRMWPGPYGDGGSRKYLLSSLDQSLDRLGINYVDVFYHHRPDNHTPVEESMMALDQAVRLGKALYVGLSNYNPQQTKEAVEILTSLGTPYVLHQPQYSMFDRWIEDGLLDILNECGMGCIVFSPLAQGLLTDKYLGGIPDHSRAAKEHGFLQKSSVTEDRIGKVAKLNAIAIARGQSLAQMAIAWTLRHPQITSALVGASSVEQITENVRALDNLVFSGDELSAIEQILSSHVRGK